MATPESTCWTVIRAAAAGGAAERDAFARRYEPVVRAYLASRWRGSPHLRDLDDAVQEVFVECFKPAGALDRADLGRDFRPFLYGVVRHVALRVERQRARRPEQAANGRAFDDVPDPEESLSRIFDRAWARALLREAAQLMEAKARSAGEAAQRRVELLRLRFHDGLPIRQIADRWNADPAVLHHQYAQARQEFKAALVEVVAFHHPASAAAVEQECVGLLSLLG
ncbi:MAG TPA: sigma-70 family RNA polymerase sigma factor [Gemmataceae bacterium]|nr:sigma-70 family RNA polymerase sigma factor [Gemmataceae bacterium]